MLRRMMWCILCLAKEGKESTGDTLRLGNYPAVFTPGSLASKVYQSSHTEERHRHRYEVNQQFLDEIARGGVTIQSGLSERAASRICRGAKLPLFCRNASAPPSFVHDQY